jgi:hypothetical protein
MDVGPLGYLSIAAHGHADALAVTLAFEGQDVIGDPGTASYYGHPRWRLVHRGTRVHATATVDGEDQSVASGPFLWARRARVHVHAIDLERGVVDAEHDGYRRLAAPVTHRRWLFASPEVDPSILIVDELSGSGDHEMRISWPLHPSLDVEDASDGYLVTHGGAVIAQIGMAASGHLVRDQFRGHEATHLGWWSHRLETRVPSWLLGAAARGHVPLVVASVISLTGAQRAVTGLAVSHEGNLITTSWQQGGAGVVAVIDRSRPGAIALTEGAKLVRSRIDPTSYESPPVADGRGAEGNRR